MRSVSPPNGAASTAVSSPAPPLTTRAIQATLHCGHVWADGKLLQALLTEKLLSQENAMPDESPDSPPEPCEPHHLNLIRDRKRMRNQYGPHSYTRGMYVNGSKTPLKPRNIRMQSSIPIIFAAAAIAGGIWFLAASEYPVGGPVMFGFAAFMLLLSWIGFRAARLRAKWEHENPDLAKNIDY